MLFSTTDTMLGEVNGTITISRPGGIFCSYGYKTCIRGLYSNCFNISNLPPGHRDCTSDDDVPKLCIDITDRSLNGSVYTLLCPRISVPDCDIRSAIDMLTYNFRLIINSTGKSFLYGYLLHTFIVNMVIKLSYAMHFLSVHMVRWS